MYLFTRQARLRPGAMRSGTEWAAGITNTVEQITGLDVRLWRSVFSPGTGSLVWATIVEDMAALETANAKLEVDNAFIDEVERGAELTQATGVDDELHQLLHGEIDPERDPKYAAVVRSALAPHGFAKAIEAGIEIAQRATAIGGSPTAFFVASTGTYGGVLWVTTTETIEELERGEQAVNGDADFITYLDDVASDVYLSGVTTQTIYQRIV